MTKGIVPTGIEGLDHLLRGGLPANRLYLVQGDPGVGKTTLALQFLIDGVRRGERTMYVAFSETLAELQDVARSHKWSLDGIEIVESNEVQAARTQERAGTIFHPSETELGAVTDHIWKTIDRVKPARLAIDSLSELRLLSGDSLRYRRQLLDIKSKLTRYECVTLMLDDRTATGDDLQLQSLVHGALSLHRLAAEYGTVKRRLEIAKLRGVAFRDGWHDFMIQTGGLVVFPRLVASDHVQKARGVLHSGLPALDSLLGGGLDRGSGTIFIGPAGVGKSTIALKFALHAAERGERTYVYNFDESLAMTRTRAAGLGMSIEKAEKDGLLRMFPVDAAELSPGQFAFEVRRAVEADEARIIILDSLNGYLNAMPGEKHLMLHLHELLAYASAKGVAVLMIISQQGVLGATMQQPVDVSYVADTVMLFRYYEHRGEIRQAISVSKRRGGQHERYIRELALGPPEGIRLGKPLHDFRGVLSGTPTYIGEA